jgi:uncharacterized membrane protein YvbJ
MAYYCPNCGSEIADGQKYCNVCGKEINPTGIPVNNSGTQKNNPPNVDNHLAKAIIVTLFCCVPLGIISIINAASVSGKLQAGDIEGAIIASKKADKMANWAIISGIIVGLIYFIAALASA